MSRVLVLSMQIAVALTALIAGVSAGRAANCGPDALGTSRVIEVGVQGGLEVGLKTYPQTLPLADHEVILTFDDGPAAKTTPQILAALARECVRATFFEIGRNAERLPQIARREVIEGHTVGSHTYSHPQETLRFMSDAAAREEVMKGMIAVEKAAYGRNFGGKAPTDLKDLKLHTPFFRFPGFADTSDLRKWLAANNVGVFSADLWAGDWTRMTPQEELRYGDAQAEPAREGDPAPARHSPMDGGHGSDASARTEGQGLQGRPYGSRPWPHGDRPRPQGLVLGDRAGDRRLEAAARKAAARKGDGPVPVKPATLDRPP